MYMLLSKVDSKSVRPKNKNVKTYWVLQLRKGCRRWVSAEKFEWGAKGQPVTIPSIGETHQGPDHSILDCSQNQLL